MIVISVSNVSASLRGDLTKWLMEIDTGVYVGRVSARIREKLWERITKNLREGKAVMVYTINNEQGYDFRLLHTDRKAVDFDGLSLIMKSVANNQNGHRNKKERIYEENSITPLINKKPNKKSR